jgi:tRNA 2-thiouridine synthesizing protein A
MAVHTLDVLGLKCPQPVLKVAAMAKNIPEGDTLEVLADCASFPKDMETWCSKTKRTLLFCIDEGGGKHKAQIQF